MIDHVIWILALLSAKHCYVDFFIQTNEEVAQKGTYGARAGIMHSFKHGVATVIALLLCSISLLDTLLLGLLDAVVHYHIDWAKININKRNDLTPANIEFWHWLGIDQMLHAFTYLFIVWSLF